MISFGATLLVVTLWLSVDTIVEIGSILTATTLEDTDLGAQIEPLRKPQTATVDLSPSASIDWLGAKD